MKDKVIQSYFVLNCLILLDSLNLNLKFNLKLFLFPYGLWKMDIKL